MCTQNSFPIDVYWIWIDWIDTLKNEEKRQCESILQNDRPQGALDQQAHRAHSEMPQIFVVSGMFKKKINSCVAAKLSEAHPLKKEKGEDFKQTYSV